MFFSGRNCNRIASLDLCGFMLDAHAAPAGSNEINFLGSCVVMLLGAAAGGQTRFSPTLIANGRVAVGEQLANFGAVFGNEGRCLVDIFYFHTAFPCWRISARAGRKKGPISKRT